MVWKTVNNSDAGTVTKHGGNDLDKIASALNGNNVSDAWIFNTNLHTLKDGTTNALGDLLVNNGTKYVRRAKGAALQVLRTNAAGTDIEWAAPSGGGGGGGGISAGGTAQFNGTGSQTVFNIAHGLGAIPDFVSVDGASDDARGEYTITKNSTNIIVTFAIPPPTGTNNVKFEWGGSTVTGGTAVDITGAANVGTGTGQVFRDEVTGVLNLKTLLAGSNVTITNNANDITIAAGAGGGVNWQDFIEQTSTPADPTTDNARIYMKDIDANNQGLFIKIKKAGVFAEMQLI